MISTHDGANERASKRRRRALDGKLKMKIAVE